ncbi:MAG: c-type cytochrome [Acidimicrobiia bacterium]
MFDLGAMVGLVMATASTEPVSTGGVGMGAVVVTIVVALLLVWMGYLFVHSRQNRASANEAAAPNLSPHVSDDELENEKLTHVLRAALFLSVLLAITMPWYAINEPDRQAAAAEAIVEEDVAAGAHWYSVTGFQCVDCHGPNGGGGAVAFTEPRSGVQTSWKVPSLNDVFYRYTEDEVRHWIVYGRAGTPMPANGLDGGGAMTVQEVDQVIAYLETIQISQQEAFDQAQTATDLALTAIKSGAQATGALIDAQEAEIALVNDAPRQLGIVGSFPDDIKDLFQDPETCTEQSAAIVNALCSDPAPDADRDGLADAVEGPLSAMATATLQTVVGASGAEQTIYAFTFDPANPFTNENPNGSEPLPDLDAAEELLSAIETEVLLLDVTVERQEAFLADLDRGLAFLNNAAAMKLWEVDYEAKAAEMGVTVDEAMTAAGLFNAYCARCHTGGYSAGSPFEQGAGSGAWGPSLLAGRAVIQFPDMADHVKFVIDGSTDSQQYGVNGLGSGRMPAFGLVLSESQIELIVMYERTL